MDRRRFIEGMAAAGAVAAAADNKLAVDGGAPVRETPLHGGNWGTAYYDSKEAAELNNVVETGKPFRWGSGRDQRLKVVTFEREFAAA